MRKNLNPSGCILIATSKKHLGAQLATELNRPDYHFITAPDGNSAVKYCHEHEDIRVMIIDSDLPGLNGYETIRQIKQIRQSEKSEIMIILVAWFSLHAMDMACKLGCDELFAKPVKHQELVNLLTTRFLV